MEKERQKRYISQQHPVLLAFEGATKKKEIQRGSRKIHLSATDHHKKQIDDLRESKRVTKESETHVRKSNSMQGAVSTESLTDSPATSNISQRSRLSETLETRLLHQLVVEKLEQTDMRDSAFITSQVPSTQEDDTTIKTELTVQEIHQGKKISENGNESSEQKIKVPQQGDTPPSKDKLLSWQVLLSKERKDYDAKEEDKDSDSDGPPSPILQKYIKSLSLSYVSSTLLPLEKINENVRLSTEASQEIEGSEIKIEKTDEKTSKHVDVVESHESFNSKDSVEKKLNAEEEEAPHKKVVVLKSKPMRMKFDSCPRQCRRFQSVEQFTKTFIKEIVEEAAEEGKEHRVQSAMASAEGIKYSKLNLDESLSTSSSDTDICIMQWPTIEQFNVSLGAAKIVEYLTYWKFEEAWKYCINFLHGESDTSCDFYQYEVIFSIPCKQYPIPQATASIFFTFELSRVRPRQCLVEVYYCFESQRFIHKPGAFTFQEKTLFNIVDAKIKFFKTLTF